MSEKKAPGRFTLQFNMKDPQQKPVSELLEQQGRHKAQFITSAILRYLQSPNPQEHDCGPPVMDETALERMLLSILERHPPFATVSAGNVPQVRESPAHTSFGAKVWDNTIDDDAIRAISDTLSAFQQS